MLGASDSTDIERRLRKIAESGEVVFRYSELPVPNRESTIRRTVYVPSMDEDGEPTCLFGITQDVTFEKNAEENMRRLSHRLLTMRNDEQRRMARSLHETASQTLAAIQLTLGKIARALPANAKTAAAGVKAARALTNEALHEIRNVSSLLHPPLLEEAGLAAALVSYVRAFSDRSGVRFHTQIPESLARMSPEVEITIYRIVQESLNNIYRHAKAKRCWLVVEQTATRFIFEIRDDGMGLQRFDESKFANALLGVGIAGMRERVLQLSGTFDIQSTRGRGTTVHVEIPIETRHSKVTEKE